jgi:hypothetical protein
MRKVMFKRKARKMFSDEKMKDDRFYQKSFFRIPYVFHEGEKAL